MPTRNYKPEQMVTILRQIEVQMANGKTAPQACQEAEMHTQTCYRWRKEYGGLKREPAKRLKELEKENGERVAGAGGGHQALVSQRLDRVQQLAAQPVEHGCGSSHRQETVRKLASQAG